MNWAPWLTFAFISAAEPNWTPLEPNWCKVFAWVLIGICVKTLCTLISLNYVDCIELIWTYQTSSILLKLIIITITSSQQLNQTESSVLVQEFGQNCWTFTLPGRGSAELNMNWMWTSWKWLVQFQVLHMYMLNWTAKPYQTKHWQSFLPPVISTTSGTISS